MKVLYLVPRIYEPVGNKYVENCAGLELYVHEIIDSLKYDVDAYVLTHSFGTEETINDINYLSHTKANLLSGVTPKRIVKAVKAFGACKGSLKTKLKNAGFQFDYGYYEKCIKRLKPDIVHFHACARGIFDNIDACRKHGIPMVVTLHGLIGLDASVGATQELIDIERELFVRADRERIPMTVISSGVKNRAVKSYGLNDPSNITVVLNGTDIGESVTTSVTHGVDIYKKYGLNEDKRIVLCVGSLIPRKNQTALVKAWATLPKSFTDKTQLVFAGRDLSNGDVQRMVTELSLVKSVRVLGFVPKEDMPSLYREASLNALVSLDEGFGLSIIEAMAYGVPTITYRDLDAVNDVYSEDAMIALDDRDKEVLARGIVHAMSTKWDYAVIRDKAKTYTMKNISRQYLDVYNSILNGR